MRIAWLGPQPDLAGGVPYMATQMLAGLPSAGVSVDAYLATVDPLPDVLHAVPGLRIVEQSTGWTWGRWYSRVPVLALGTAQVARARAQARLVRRLVAMHRDRPYDLIYQFSQTELPWLRALRGPVPPIVVHPEVHAAGELRWHRREAALSRRGEAMHARVFARGLLALRSRVQRRDLRHVTWVIAPSRRFAAELTRDYGVPPARVRVVPNAVDLERFSPVVTDAPRAPSRPVEILFVSRISVRKGVEMVIGLSHRIIDLAGRVRLRLVGGHALFSDYRRLLSDLHPAIGRFDGPLTNMELAAAYRSADALIQPSHYEPFGLTVAEGLASGLPVVVSDQVGAAEDIDPRCCRTFPAGALDRFEVAVRALVDELSAGGGPSLAALARREAERRFAPPIVMEELATTLTGLVDAGPRRA
jgi:glycosyltransferase involved in cell wall biosynthesis